MPIDPRTFSGAARHDDDRDRRDRNRGRKRRRSPPRPREDDRRERRPRYNDAEEARRCRFLERRKLRAISRWDMPASHPMAIAEMQSAAAAAAVMSANADNFAGQVGVDDRSARRLYVGGVPASASDMALRHAFTTMFTQQFPDLVRKQPNFIKGINCVPHKGFAFVEFFSPDLATAATALDGMPFQNASLRVRRPSDYRPPPGAPPDPTPSNMPRPVHVPGVISTAVPNSPHKIFCGGLPPSLTRPELIELFQAYGELRGLNLIMATSPDEGNRGYCFFEYVDPNVTNDAIGGLNGLALGDRVLTVSYADGTQRAGPTAVAAVPFAPPPVATKPATRVLVLLEMVTAEDVQDDEEYRDIYDDIKEECSTYGSVLNLVIPRHGTHVGKVFIEYATEAESAAARGECEGRKFGGRIVGADYISPEEFSSVS